MTSTGARLVRTGLGMLAAFVLVAGSLAGCSKTGGTAGATPSASTSQSESPGATGTASPSETESPGEESASPSGTPSESGSAAPSGTASPSPTGPVTCNQVEPSRLGKITPDPKRTTEVATVVSDGRNITAGSSEQTEFVTARLVGFDGTVVNDGPTMSRIAAMVEDSSKNVVLLTRPDPPDGRADVTKRPFNSPGTYALFNASSELTVEVIVVCGGQQQVWTFTAEGNPTTGLVNCAVEPSRSNIIARLVYQNAC